MRFDLVFEKPLHTSGVLRGAFASEQMPNLSCDGCRTGFSWGHGLSYCVGAEVGVLKALS